MRLTIASGRRDLLVASFWQALRFALAAFPA
jgi:hypothetical protein